MINALVTIGQSAHLRLHGFAGRLSVLAPETSLDLWAAHGLDGNIGRQRPEVRVSNGARDVLVSDGLQQTHSHIWKSGVGTESPFTCICESHHCVGATALQIAIREDARIVPGQSNQNWTALLLRHQLLTMPALFC
eukprot:Skav206577  [mRNA]  locus=scaffold925:758752:763683:+ [translate_table: standard]